MIATGGAQAGLVTIRQAAPGDRDALTEMFDRCTAQTRYRRFHGGVTVFPRRYLAEALSRSPVHHALIASARDGTGDMTDSTVEDPAGQTIVALASCRVVEEGMAEVGILVEDTWQRHGVGSALLDELAAHAKAIGLRALTAQLLTEQAWTAGMLARYGPIKRSPASRGVVTVTVRLAPGDAPRGAPAGPRLSCRPAATRSASA
ncbi:GNAT family N-acetyltransferase [Trebonia kvetii]|uniref:GNAT family N-acetyltransferase n=1 Tax=Trebonia kvetii TaxID=2480626 RepID=A0A6P2C284_9ACTN|nr:GNAT family N-acetyltransferase [Trebonia kvetii]TVZ05499.1 GNAT family N-acetyltransferase [Trebonia kvetii]